MTKKTLLYESLLLWCVGLLLLAGGGQPARAASAARRADPPAQILHEASADADRGPGLQEPAYGSLPEVKP